MKKSALFIVMLFLTVNAYTAYGSGIDEYTKLLVHSDKFQGNGNFEDSSPSAHSISSIGDTHHSENEAKFGNTSIFFDGDGDYLEVPNSNDFNLGAGDFTIDFWIKFPNFPPSSYYYILNIGNDWTPSHEDDLRITFIPTYGKGIQIDERVDGAGVLHAYEETSWDNNWHHVAIVRNGDSIQIFKDGIDVTAHQVIPQSHSIANPSSSLFIGKQNRPGMEQYLYGYLDEVRISNIARWTENFTTPTRPYTTCRPDYNRDGIVDIQDLMDKQRDVLQELQGWTENCWRSGTICQ